MTVDLSEMPRVDTVAGRSELGGARDALGPKLLTELVRAAIDAARTALLRGDRSDVPTEEDIAAAVLSTASSMHAARARRVINATGVMLHTNLGRAPLSARAAAAVSAGMQGYSSIELDLESGKRGRRAAFLESALANLSGSEDALVVNNCAAAVLLMLAAVARGGAVIVSRGELVEIGGGFRVPDVMAESGARLVEVGTTNKTRVEDYERALDQNPDAIALLRVHQGNFRQLGFVERPDLTALGALARARGVLLLKDLGGGALVDLGAAGFPGEPLVQSCIAAGCAAVTFSTDKVLGGPQGGALVGSSSVVQRARKHPLARALRLGRLPILALEATLEAYLLGRAWEEIPALSMAQASVAELETRVRSWVEALAAKGISSRCVPSTAEMGGGTLAARTIPSVALELAPLDGLSADDVAKLLRGAAVPVIGRVADGKVLLEARTIQRDQDGALIEAISAASR